MSCASRSYWSACLGWICRATLLLFCLFEHVDGFRCRLDELGGIASKSGFQIREDTNNLLGTTPIVQLRCDVCCSQSGAHHGQRDQHTIPSVATWRNLGRSTIICAAAVVIRCQLRRSLPVQFPCSKVNLLLFLVFPLLRSRCISFPRFCLLTRVTALLWL